MPFLYVVCGAGLTNIASAWLMQPEVGNKRWHLYVFNRSIGNSYAATNNNGPEMKKRTILSIIIAWATCCMAQAQLDWGDQGNGTYKNPVLNADYSDPDVIRVGQKYYMVASDFHLIGMQVLESSDMVNWQIVSQIYQRFDLPGWDENKHYAGASWAPSIRWHDRLAMAVVPQSEQRLLEPDGTQGLTAIMLLVTHVINRRSADG